MLRPASTRAFTDHHQAHDPLIDAIGDYCSYCEIPTSKGIEHVLPWDGKHTALRTEWTNFLLFCDRCNANKRSRQNSKPYGDTAAARAKYLWPDTDNTARAFIYTPTFKVEVAPGLPAPADQLARDTHHMLGFEKIDRRWRKRKQTWTAAEEAKRLLDANAGVSDMRAMARLAIPGGCWSVWRTVFSSDSVMLALINDVFTGTDPSSFDPVSYAPVPRPGGRL